MMTVDLLRHGELQGGVKYRGRIEGLLTAQGRQKMDDVWQTIQSEVDVIISSPLLRCAEPAQIWAAEKTADFHMDERLAEMHYGEWEGLSHAEIETKFPGVLEKWREDPSGMRPPGGESPEELLARVESFWLDLCEKYQHQHVLLVAHSGSSRMLITHILKKPIAYTRKIPMPYACWSRVNCLDGNSEVEFVNKYDGT
ncbi:MAG: histidine phosphatase family protein [Mariprofundaceae bacterium]